MERAKCQKHLKYKKGCQECFKLNAIVCNLEIKYENNKNLSKLIKKESKK
jgi:hypothetical protein